MIDPTKDDDVILEVRRIKEDLAAEFDFDIDRVVADIPGANRGLWVRRQRRIDAGC